jgi:hypothetical protein
LSKACIVLYNSNMESQVQNPVRARIYEYGVSCVSMGNGIGGLFVQGTVSTWKRDSQTKDCSVGLQHHRQSDKCTTKIRVLGSSTELQQLATKIPDSNQWNEAYDTECTAYLRDIVLKLWVNESTEYAAWFRHCATNRKVAGSIPNDVIGIFHWHNPSGRTMALGSTQPLTEMSTKIISWG